MVNTAPKIHDKVFQLRCNRAWLDAIDAWRAWRPKPLSRAEAIRQLVQKALKSTN